MAPPNQRSLISRLAIRTVIVVPLCLLVLFVPAGSLRFWQGWVFVGLTIGAGVLQTVYLYRRDRELLERRMRNREPSGEQKRFRVLWIPLWIAIIVLPGLDYRFGWSRTLLAAVPLWLELLSQGFIAGSQFVMFQVLKVNTFASSTIQIEAGHKVISTGPYGVVRHPLYSGILLMILFTPTALGSYVSLPVSALLVPVLLYRLIHEERMLRTSLPGYSDYCLQTRFRLVPFVW